jgi:hypothetical protein
MAKLAVYRVLSLDVWGNEEDGWDLNQSFSTNRLYEIDFEDDEQILAQLKASGELADWISLDDIDIDGDQNTLFIENSHNSRPLLHLEFVEPLYGINSEYTL